MCLRVSYEKKYEKSKFFLQPLKSLKKGVKSGSWSVSQRCGSRSAPKCPTKYHCTAPYMSLKWFLSKLCNNFTLWNVSWFRTCKIAWPPQDKNLGGEGPLKSFSWLLLRRRDFALPSMSLILLRIKALLNLKSIGSRIFSAGQILNHIQYIVVRIRKTWILGTWSKSNHFRSITTQLKRLYFELCCCVSLVNIELDLQSLFGLHVTWCAQLYILIGWDPWDPASNPPPPAFGLIRERY